MTKAMASAQVIRGLTKGISRAVGAAVGDVTDRETRVGLLFAMGEVDKAVERLLCTLDRAVREAQR